MANNILPLNERFDHLLNILQSSKFLKSININGEVPFYICPYPAIESIEMDKMRNHLSNQLVQLGVQVLDMNLYDLALSILKQRDNLLGAIFQQEPEMDKAELFELLQNVLDPKEHLVPAIAKKMLAKEFDVLFISGVGEVFPYIRSHNLLNNLQSTAKEKPTLMFFPGEYSYSVEKGSALNIFGKLRDDKYYRAFNIYQIHA